MRLLVTIPHYFRHTEAGTPFYDSEKGFIEARRDIVERCLAAINQTFGPHQALFGPTMAACNTPANHIDVVLITTGEDHLADLLPAPLFHHYRTSVTPRHLGFVCHEFLREHSGRYDWYAYLEDDIEVSDPLLFEKLRWFGATFHPAALLQPNRYELASDLSILKMYVDGQMNHPEMARRHQDITVNARLEAELLGRTFRFDRVDNVHAGCFFLDGRQLARVAAAPAFGRPTDAFCGPLESAATLPLMQAFQVYKPDRENAGFLEVRHLGRRFLAPTGPRPSPEPDPVPTPESEP